MNKLGVIVPYRNRYDQLVTWTRELKYYLDSKGLNYNIIVVEQDDASAFNRGMLCNIGFEHATKRGCDYVVFHDVDMIPVNVDYSKSDTPIHLFNELVPFENYFGGMTLFPSDTFKKINGFSNLYWGWGYEDDDLRYRCASHNIDFGTKKENPYSIPTASAIFNGKNSIAYIPNTLKYSVDLTIDITGQLGHVEMDPKKPFDQYTILSIKGNDFQISYNSFNRFTVQVYDKGYDQYTLNSSPTIQSAYNLRLEYISRTKTLTLIINGKVEDTIILKNRIFDYSKVPSITIGADSEKNNYYKGSIDKVLLYTRKDELVSRYTRPNHEKYTWIDTIRRKRGVLENIDIGPYTPPETIEVDSIVPYRRKGSIYKLPHEDNGYIGGRWKSDLTRWNQLRYNNEVKRGVYNNSDDGLKNCEYITHSKQFKDKVFHINVGI